jgi:hypothetical protein
MIIFPWWDTLWGTSDGMMFSARRGSIMKRSTLGICLEECREACQIRLIPELKQAAKEP